jgi:hypothetical protein
MLIWLAQFSSFSAELQNFSIELRMEFFLQGGCIQWEPLIELELELIQTQMAQKPMLRAEVGMRVRCANKASAE